MKDLRKIHNLLLNCDSMTELNEYKLILKLNVKTTALAAYPVSVLSPIYFKTPKNTREIHARTYASKRTIIFGAI